MVMLFVAPLELLEIACRSADVKGQLAKFAMNSVGPTPQPALTLSCLCSAESLFGALGVFSLHFSSLLAIVSLIYFIIIDGNLTVLAFTVYLVIKSSSYRARD